MCRSNWFHPYEWSSLGAQFLSKSYAAKIALLKWESIMTIRNITREDDAKMNDWICSRLQRPTWLTILWTGRCPMFELDTNAFNFCPKMTQSYAHLKLASWWWITIHHFRTIPNYNVVGYISTYIRTLCLLSQYFLALSPRLKTNQHYSPRIPP